MSDFDRTFNIWTDVGLFCFIVFVLVSVIRFHGSESKSKTFVTDKGQRITLVSDGNADFTDTTLVSYDFITGDAVVKLSSGEEKVYNLKVSSDVLSTSNVLNIAGMTDKYSIISGVGEYVTKMFVKYALANRLYGHLLDVVDYNHENKELIYLDSRSGKHYLKLGIKGFYNIDQSKIAHQTSSGGSFLTGFFVGRYLK